MSRKVSETAPPAIDGLDDRQARAVAMLAEGNSGRKVARELGVDRRTVIRWRENPAFAAALAEVRREGVELARVRLSGALETAVTTLVRVLRDKETPAAVKVRAAEIVLARAGVGDETDHNNNDANDRPLTEEDLALVRKFMAERDGQGETGTETR